MATVEVFAQTVGDTFLLLTQNDTAIVAFQLFGRDDAGKPAVQSTDGAQAVEYKMTRALDGVLVQDWTPCTMSNAPLGMGTVNMVTSQRGSMIGRFRVTFEDGSQRTFPDAWDFTVLVRA